MTLEHFENNNFGIVPELVVNEDGSLLRLIQPIRVGKSCLKCHAQQGYKEGDIKGGVSSSVSIAPFL